MTETVTLEFRGGQMRFSAGHFTIFSDTRRERLHGHNYHLEASVTADVLQPGMTFDYSVFREKLITLCKQLHTRFILAGESPFMTIDETDEHYNVTFNGKSMSLLKEDVLVLPLTNITIEEMSRWFTDQVNADAMFMAENKIRQFSISVFNGQSHGGTTICC